MFLIRIVLSGAKISYAKSRGKSTRAELAQLESTKILNAEKATIQRQVHAAFAKAQSAPAERKGKDAAAISALQKPLAIDVVQSANQVRRQEAKKLQAELQQRLQKLNEQAAAGDQALAVWIAHITPKPTFSN
jgi:hypothetical protein